MRKLLVLALVIVSMLGIVAAPVGAQTSLATPTLLAGKDINAGTVAVSVEGDTLTVTFSTTDGWQMKETHLYAAVTAPSRSAPGRFPFIHEELANVTEDTFQVSLSAIGAQAGATVFIAAQAGLQKPLFDDAGNPVLDSEGNQIILEESAWASGEPIPPGKNWAMFFRVTLPQA